jgi:hypothetical protein
MLERNQSPAGDRLPTQMPSGTSGCFCGFLSTLRACQNVRNAMKSAGPSRRFLGVGLLAASLFVGASAQDQSKMRIALGGFSGDATLCYAYYSVLANCIRKQNPELATRADEAAQGILKMSFDAGKAVGISQRTILARTQIALNEQTADIDDDCTNVAVILNKHAPFCKNLQEHGTERLQAIIDGTGK